MGSSTSRVDGVETSLMPTFSQLATSKRHRRASSSAFRQRLSSSSTTGHSNAKQEPQSKSVVTGRGSQKPRPGFVRTSKPQIDPQIRKFDKVSTFQAGNDRPES
jgi:hypothetical protein